MRDALSLVVALALAGCTLVTDLPPVAPESCDDGVDDDLDGFVDCDDPSCAGRCDVEGATRCRDGIDQDGDGLTDYLDPQCWPEAELAVERCTSIRGGVWSGSMDATAWAGSARLSAAPDGSPALRAEVESAHLLALELTSGFVEGTTLTAQVWVTHLGGASLALLPESEGVLGGLEGAGVLVVTIASREALDGTLDRIGVVGVSHGLHQLDATVALVEREAVPVEGWLDVRVELRADVVRVLLPAWAGCAERAEDGFCEVVGFSRAGLLSPPRVPGSWSATEPLRFGFGTLYTAVPTWARAPRIERQGADECGHAVPQLEGPVVAVATDGEGLCALTRATRGERLIGGLEAWRSADGRTWEWSATIDPPGPGLVDAAMRWDPAEAAFLGVASAADAEGRVVDLSRFTLRGCRDLERFSPSGLGDELVSPIAHGGLVLGDPATLLVPVVAPPGALWLTAVDGNEGFHFQPGRFELPPRVGTNDRLAFVRGQRLALRSRGDAVSLVVERGRAGGAGWLELPTPLLAVSGVPGTFDRRTLGAAELLMPPPPPLGEPWTGWVLYVGDEGTSTGVVELQVRPRD